MTIHAGTNWEVRTTGNDTNGGGYSATIAGAGVDYSQQDSSQLSVTDGACTGNTTLTSATGGFTSAMVGNVVYMSSGPTFRTISAFVDSNTVTLAGNGPNASGMTCNVGGCLATPGRLSNIMVASNRAWVRGGTYAITTATPGPSGPFSLASSMGVIIEGYGTTRGDLSSNRPVLFANGFNNVDLWSQNSTNSSFLFHNLAADGNSLSNTRGFVSGVASQPARLCSAINCRQGFNYSRCISCYAENCTEYGFSGNMMIDCVGVSCREAFRNVFTSIACIAKNCVNHGFLSDNPPETQTYCIADNCNTGFDGRINAHSCVAVNNTNGFRQTLGDLRLFNCAGFNNTNNTSGTPQVNENFRSLASSPFVSATDYTLTAEAAALLEVTPFLGQAWKKYIGAIPPIGTSGGEARPVNPFTQQVIG